MRVTADEKPFSACLLNVNKWVYILATDEQNFDEKVSSILRALISFSDRMHVGDIAELDMLRVSEQDLKCLL